MPTQHIGEQTIAESTCPIGIEVYIDMLHVRSVLSCGLCGVPVLPTFADCPPYLEVCGFLSR